MNFSRSGSRATLAYSGETKHAQLSTGNSLLSDQAPTEQQASAPGLFALGANKGRLRQATHTHKSNESRCFSSCVFLHVKDTVFAFQSSILTQSACKGEILFFHAPQSIWELQDREANNHRKTVIHSITRLSDAAYPTKHNLQFSE